MISSVMTPEHRAEALKKAVDLMFEIIPTKISRVQVSEWAEDNRVIPPGLSPYPGPYSWEVNPYMREIADCLSESSPVREVAVMKGTQIMATVGLGENWIGYTIDASPGPMLYVSGDAGMAEQQMELRIDAMIDGAGIGHKIAAQSKRKNQRKTGDVKARKEFPGGFLIAAGPRSGSKLRSMSFQSIYADELDAFPDSTGKEGDPIYLIRRRVDAYSETYKILYTSTPLFEHNSKIRSLFLEGDQRRYFVPCKHCGHMQYLKWDQLKFERNEDNTLVCELDNDGQIVSSSVFYQCEKCDGEWKNSDKDYFLHRGEWRPTATPRRPGMRSYHVPGLLSPVGFRSWENAVVEYLQIKHEGYPKLKYQNWINTFLGEAFYESGEKPKLEVLLSRERDYHVGELPEGAEPYFVTIGADIQGDRIEAEVVAWGHSSVSWSLGYYIFPGDTSDEENDCYDRLRHLIESEHAGMPVLLAGIDAGYRTDTVYSFADSFEQGVHPVMGFEQIDRGKTYIKPREVDGHSTFRIDVNTDLLKLQVYKYLSKGHSKIAGKLPLGYCHFPIEYKREHYMRLTAENRIREQSANGTVKFRWDSGNRRNEQLDCRVYALAMVHAYKSVVDSETGDDVAMPWSEFWDLIAMEVAV
jgi:phage terminase large subunit GpA-like protein